MGPKKVTIKVVLEEISELKDLITQNENKMIDKQEQFMMKIHSELTKIEHNNDCMGKIESYIHMIVEQNQTIQMRANEDYLVIISYEKERKKSSYCETVLSNFKVSKNDILGCEILFSNDVKVVYKVKLSSKYKVKLVLKEKTCLRGRRLYIHRPYTDIEKKLRSKQLSRAKELAETKSFKLFKNILHVSNLVYEWKPDIEDFIFLNENDSKDLTNENNTTEVTNPISNEPADDSVTTVNHTIETNVSEENLEYQSEQPSSNCAISSSKQEEDQVTKADIMKLAISISEKFDKITSSTLKFTRNLDEVNKKYNQQFKPP